MPNFVRVSGISRITARAYGARQATRQVCANVVLNPNQGAHHLVTP